MTGDKGPRGGEVLGGWSVSLLGEGMGIYGSRRRDGVKGEVRHKQETGVIEGRILRLQKEPRGQRDVK